MLALWVGAILPCLPLPLWAQTPAAASTPPQSSPAAPVAPAIPIPPTPDSSLARDSVRSADSLTAAAEDSTQSANDSLVLRGQFYDYVAYPFLQAVTWPIEVMLVPAVRALIYPIKPPVRYIVNENVIDRTIQLISFGSDQQVMIYPTMSLGPGTGSQTGFTLRHKSIFGRSSERLVASGSFYVNGDWRFRSYITAADVLGTPLDMKLSASLNRIKNSSVNQPGTNAFYRFADTSNTYTLGLDYPVFWKFNARLSVAYRDLHFGTAPADGTPENQIVSDFFDTTAGVSQRGLQSEWADRLISIGTSRDTRNNTNIPLSGSTFNAGWVYHFTSAHHDFHNWEARWTGYFKLGKERYEISSAEERKGGAMNLKKVLKAMEMEKLRAQIFNRKVLVMQFYAAQAYEVGGNRMPTYGLTTLGNDTPLRGYGGSRFRDYATAAMSLEYRFPVMRLVDGTIFDEYGNVGRSLEDIDYLGYKNSWGFGVRVRRPDIFLFRAQLGFHGTHGIEVNLSVDEPF